MPPRRQLQVELVRIPEGIPVREDFRLREADVPEPGPGQFLARVVYLSLDPFIRPALAGRHLGHEAPIPGSDVPGYVVGQVEASRHAGFEEGAHVVFEGCWAEYVLSDGKRVRLVDPALAPLSTAVGVLGMPGLTAWAGVELLASPKPGATFVVSAALGPVGATAGQLAKMRGCRVIGIAGSERKRRYVVEGLGFDACLDYKDGGLQARLSEACPEGIDAYFDNVGGEVLRAVVPNLRHYGKVVLCGLASQYNSAAPVGLPLGPVIARRAQLLGLVVYDFEDRYPEFLAQAAPRLREGRLKYAEDRAAGLAAAPAAFHRLMRGENFGKSLVVVSPEHA